MFRAICSTSGCRTCNAPPCCLPHTLRPTSRKGDAEAKKEAEFIAQQERLAERRAKVRSVSSYSVA
jgi:hypothetical protein